MAGDRRPRPAADGGTRSTGFFESFPDPLLEYACDDTSGEEGEGADPGGREFVVRRVNPAFEAAFDIGTDDIAGTPLDGVALAGRVRPGRGGDDSTKVTDSSEPDGPGSPESSESSESADVPDTTVPSPATTAAALLEHVREVGTGLRFDWKGDGETRHFRVRAVASGPPDEAGYLVFTDVTGPERERRTLEGRVEHLERVASVARHDLRNPLEVARIRLEAARDTGEDVHFEKLAGALDRIEGIAREVLATGDGNVDPTEAVALGAVAEAAWETVDTTGAALVTSPGLPVVRGDADQLRGLFENLFRNSVEHGSTSSRPGSDDPVEHGGRDVTVTVEPLPDGFAVADDGPGVPEDIREHVFEAGYSTGENGSGLGLSIVRQVAREHGWRVSLASEKGSSVDADANADGGARFEFTGIERVDDGNEPDRPSGSGE